MLSTARKCCGGIGHIPFPPQLGKKYAKYVYADVVDPVHAPAAPPDVIAEPLSPTAEEPKLSEEERGQNAKEVIGVLVAAIAASVGSKLSPINASSK